VALLESKVQQVAASPQPEPAPPLPEMAQLVAGQTYVMDPNPTGLLSISLSFPQEAEALLSLTFSAGPDEKLVKEWPVGLDNVYRFTPHEYGLSMGVKGGWESDNCFVIHRDVIGGYERERLSATFEEDQITVQIRSISGGDSVTLVGRLE
jgi:hypothetical protein